MASRLQIHLASAIVLMFCAAGLLWLNMPYPLVYRQADGTTAVVDDCFGWPLPMNYSSTMRRPWYWRNVWNPLGIEVDVLVAALLLVAMWLCCEALARRYYSRTAESAETGTDREVIQRLPLGGQGGDGKGGCGPEKQHGGGR
ncbi:MAG: hypothetical protein NTW87_08245 [Planctomycetota bacterium]|nr:hypothetical protein [Planctomycetota bacterium]